MHFQISRERPESLKYQVMDWLLHGGFLAVVFTVLLSASGCSNEPDSKPQKPGSVTPLAPDAVLRVHWVGKKHLGVAASAYSLMRLWNLAESKQVETQVLEKLSMAPWRMPAGEPRRLDDARAAFQPLIDDILNAESCLEIRSGTGGLQQCVFAIRVDNADARVWQANLAHVITSIEKSYPSQRENGWLLKPPGSPKIFELDRACGWTVLGVAEGTNTLMREIIARICREQTPFTTTTNEHWLTVEAETKWAVTRLGLPVTGTNLPRINLVVSGDGANVLTTGDLTFPSPLAISLPPWNFPKDQMQDPVIGFSASRGVRPWLESSKLWTEFKLGPAPNQLFTWADARAPLHMYFAAPDDSASQLIKDLNGTFLSHGNAWLAEHGLGNLAQLPGANGIIWKDLPIIAPHLSAASDSILLGGLMANPEPGTNAPSDIYPRLSVNELLATLDIHTNLVAYEWETTGDRAESFQLLSQILRVATRHPQMDAGAAGSQWLQNVRQRLGNATTMVTQTSPTQLSFERKSAVGFTAAELHLLIDWMESPEFPRGLFSTLSPVAPALTPNPSQ